MHISASNTAISITLKTREVEHSYQFIVTTVLSSSISVLNLAGDSRVIENLNGLFFTSVIKGLSFISVILNILRMPSFDRQSRHTTLGILARVVDK